MKQGTKHQRVSVIVPTRNSERTLQACLESIVKQSYKDIELLVVDNNSSDKTKQIAHKYTKKVYNRGPERCTQRNYGALQSSGQYVCFIDSDMELAPDVISEAVAQQSTQKKAVIIPEESFGEGYWARCKRLERMFYVGVDWLEAARFMSKDDFDSVNGYDESLVSGEDWDLSQRVLQGDSATRTTSYIFHDEGKLSLKTTLQKKYYYSSKIMHYVAKSENSDSRQLNPLYRYLLFASKPRLLIRRPHITVGMLLMKTLEFIAGALGILRYRLSR